MRQILKILDFWHSTWADDSTCMVDRNICVNDRTNCICICISLYFAVKEHIPLYLHDTVETMICISMVTDSDSPVSTEEKINCGATGVSYHGGADNYEDSKTPCASLKINRDLGNNTNRDLECDENPGSTKSDVFPLILTGSIFFNMVYRRALYVTQIALIF